MPNLDDRMSEYDKAIYESLVTNSVELQTLTELLVRKGLITMEELKDSPFRMHAVNSVNAAVMAVEGEPQEAFSC